MHRISLSILSALLMAPAACAAAQEFDRWFDDATLRLDYIFAGDSSHSAIYLEELARSDGWAGRRHHLDAPYLAGNGSVTVCDAASGDTIYTNTFSTLFQEWITTPEAKSVSKAFESTYLVPFPKQPVDVTVALTDHSHKRVAELTHRVDPADILIRRLPECTVPNRYVHLSGSPAECVDIVVLADGYTAEETDKFFADAQRAADALFSHEPFMSMASRFNVLAVAPPSADSGPDVPREGKWGDTQFGSHFDTFYSDRYLTTQQMHKIYDAVASLPVEHIILLVNTPIYGGGGIFNQITISSSDHPTFKSVLVHEFGHAYGGLADEYAYAGAEDDTYVLDVEPWEPNITTLVDFPSKWADLVPEGTPVPTPLADAPALNTLDLSNPRDAKVIERLTQTVGVFEGGGYKLHGIYRPAQECRMKVNDGDFFCPVCTRAIVGITKWYTE